MDAPPFFSVILAHGIHIPGFGSGHGIDQSLGHRHHSELGAVSVADFADRSLRRARLKAQLHLKRPFVLLLQPRLVG
jgi:hypothetical protein